MGVEMEVIFVLAFLALIALWAFSLIGLVNPKKWQRLHKNKDVTRKDVFVGCIAGSAILIIVMVISVPDLDSNSVSGKTASKAIEENTESVNQKIDYEIVSDEKRGNITRKVSVDLPERISEQQLRQIANEIKNEDSNRYERTFIMYQIRGEKSVAAWATTHFDPNVNIKFIGLNADDYQKLLDMDTSVNGEVIGKWVSPNGFTDHIVVMYKKDKKYFKQDFYLDATMKPYELLKDGNTYRYKDRDETQYFVLDQNSDLEYRGESGNIYIAKKFKK